VSEQQLANGLGGGHGHRDCGARDRVWLNREYRAPATAARHPYCVVCGTVRSLSWPPARPLGFFQSGLAALKDYLERAGPGLKLAQVQSHLLANRLAARPEFEDPYGTPGEVQLHTYVEVVRSVRPDLDEELILRLLPGVRRRRREEASR
jgi:hypothetical protein